MGAFNQIMLNLPKRKVRLSMFPNLVSLCVECSCDGVSEFVIIGCRTCDPVQHLRYLVLLRPLVHRAVCLCVALVAALVFCLDNVQSSSRTSSDGRQGEKPFSIASAGKRPKQERRIASQLQSIEEPITSATTISLASWAGTPPISQSQLEWISKSFTKGT